MCKVAITGMGIVSCTGNGLDEVSSSRRACGVRKVGPCMVPRTMCSTVSASLATAFGIRGASYSISAACATSAHCIGAAADLIRAGRQDIVFGGGDEELHWATSLQFDSRGALSTQRNDNPARASRPYDAGRDGFVIDGGGGMLVLEDYEHARARGSRIHAVLAGYGISSDGADMVGPPAKERCAACIGLLKAWTPASTTSTRTAPRPHWAT